MSTFSKEPPVRAEQAASHQWARTSLAPPVGADQALSVQWHADIKAARRLVLTTVVVAAVAAGAIEYAGLQIVERLAASATTSSFGQWGLGLARNLGGALGVGAGASALAMLVPRSWKRPWRALSSAFALGTAAFLVFLTFMVSLAP
ncbi:MAG TPA: hypothetical protein VFM71_07465 [Gemmatimonadaceae bacterium]|nr:hypothetical protein [Gemmatimonadaceae bacterium]